MQFVASGPDIPEALLRAHEEGRVVFFCGAGISYPAGLPSFKGLVDAVYGIVGTTPSAIEQEAFVRNQFDATLDLLQQRLPGQRFAVRKAVAAVLQPNLRRKGATDTHAALLQLARSRDGALRLVTTNFDRIFARLTFRAKPAVPSFPAPLLPIPKNSRWNGLVYLHGLLPRDLDESELNRLVLTSGDFGLAYLTERWAARFVSELFRNYVVCFVGYSINDPVLRYMMDALAADRMLGEVTPQAYALGEFEHGQEEKKKIEWEAKGVAPILYEVPGGTSDHSALHGTLKVWAKTYRDGILGMERIIVDNAMARPSASTRQDDFVGRVLWALSHESGLPAKRFAEFDPVPPLDWLEALSTDRYEHHDLLRFGVAPSALADKKVRFSFVRRPTAYQRKPWMLMASGGASESEWDDVMLHLARWLVRHLNDPALVLWLAQRGGQLHHRLAGLIEDRLNTFARFEREGRKDELAQIRSHATNAIPGHLLRVVWRLMLSGRVKSPRAELDLYGWKERLERDGLTALLRFELRDLLAPRVKLTKPVRWRDEEVATGAPERLRQLIDWELVLAADHPRSALADLAANDQWRGALSVLFEDFQQLLRDALDMRRELGDTDERSDRSYWYLPSISQHWQNKGFSDWVTLIELVRDAWLAIHKSDPSRATRIASAWFALPYSTFQRLALFAASHDEAIASDQWVEWLVADDAHWLWSVDTKRETFRLLVLQGHHLTRKGRARLEAAILFGPPRVMYRADLEPDAWQAVSSNAIWLHLAKLKSSGANLGRGAARSLKAMSVSNPQWHLEPTERDEFSSWMSGTGDPDFESSRVIDVAPRRRVELVDWLKRPQPSQGLFYEDTWRDVCRDRFFHSALALCDLSREGQWPAKRWSEALQVWSDESRTPRSWRFLAPLIQNMPDDVFEDIGNDITRWLEVVAKSLDSHHGLFPQLCWRILAITHNDGVYADQSVDRAINHPVGHVAQALLTLWFRREPNDNDGLPSELQPLFTKLCDTGVVQFRHGRVLLASRIIALFRVDRAWTEAHLLPVFDWAVDPAEARAVWSGFLWSPRLYPPLLIAFKDQLLNTTRHYGELGDPSLQRQLAAFVTYAALEPVETYTLLDFRNALDALPQEGLNESAQALVQALEGAGEQREDYWVNRIQPFLQAIWPKSRDLASLEIAERFARLSIAARGQFPAAVDSVLDWIQPLEHPHFVVRLLAESDLSQRFPDGALRLLNAAIGTQQWAPRELRQCLVSIVQGAPALKRDSRYQRLDEYARRHGI